MRPLIRKSLRLLIRNNVSEPFNSIKIGIQEHFKGRKLDMIQIKKFKQFIKLRSMHYPVQYLCSNWPFRQLDLKLKKPVLIPRFQSEYMIEKLIQQITKNYNKEEVQGLTFVQYGCGSGALGLSLVKQLNMKGILIDIKKSCIDLTMRNATRNQINIEKLIVIRADMAVHLDIIQTADIVISNPPYLSQEHYQKYLKSQIKKYEDKEALVTDQFGMKYINMIVNEWQKRTKKGILMLQFDGRPLGDLQPFVLNDQYGQRRFILLHK